MTSGYVLKSFVYIANNIFNWTFYQEVNNNMSQIYLCRDKIKILLSFNKLKFYKLF